MCALKTHRHLSGNAKHGDPVRNRHPIARHVHRCAGRLLEVAGHARRTIGVGALIGGRVLAQPLCVLPEVNYLGRHLRFAGREAGDNPHRHRVSHRPMGFNDAGYLCHGLR